jgi:hypothetical protein
MVVILGLLALLVLLALAAADVWLSRISADELRNMGVQK